jgi:hypothetical protein
MGRSANPAGRSLRGAVGRGSLQRRLRERRESAEEGWRECGWIVVQARADRPGGLSHWVLA